MGHGSLHEFSPKEESFENYLKHFEFYCKINDIADRKQKYMFLTAIGREGFAKASDLISPQSLEEASFDEIKSKLTEHYLPKRVEIAERFKFFQRKQGTGESIADYLADLRKLARNANFGEYLEKALRDQLVCGMTQSRCQKELLCMPTLTLEAAVQHARAFEAVATESLLFSTEPADVC